jgi:hypothetical protein
MAALRDGDSQEYTLSAGTVVGGRDGAEEGIEKHELIIALLDPRCGKPQIWLAVVFEP